MSVSLSIDHRPEPKMPSACGSGCGCASAKPAPAPMPSHGRVSVNEIEIGADAIAREIQNHPSGDPDAAWQAAARALVIRELILQAARDSRIEVEAERDGLGRVETSEEAMVRGMLDAALEPPRAEAAECMRYYEANPHRFRTPDLFEASHILFEPGSDDAEGWNSAGEEARAIAREIGDDPGDFAVAAREFSACPTSKQDGSLGQVRRGELVAEVHAALEKLAEGQTSREPVRSRFGWHVLRLQRIIPGRQLPYDVVAAKIADMLEARAWMMSATAYMLKLAGDARIEGVVIHASGIEDPR